MKKHYQKVVILKSYHIPTISLRITTRATGTATPRLFLIMTQVKKESAILFGSTCNSVWMWKTTLEETSNNLLRNTSPVLVSYIKYLTVILSKLVTAAHKFATNYQKTQ